MRVVVLRLVNIILKSSKVGIVISKKERLERLYEGEWGVGGRGGCVEGGREEGRGGKWRVEGREEKRGGEGSGEGRGRKEREEGRGGEGRVRRKGWGQGVGGDVEGVGGSRGGVGHVTQAVHGCQRYFFAVGDEFGCYGRVNRED